MNTYLFTPRDRHGNRLEMQIDETDNAKVGSDVPYIVTDRLTEKRWRIERAYCGLGCRCDAIAEPVVSLTVV